MDESLIEVPGVSGLRPEAAGGRLGDAGFTPGGQLFEPSDEVASGYVLGTTPPAGTLAPEGTLVGLVVSTGTAAEADDPPSGLVPDVAGLTFEQAEGVLAGAGYAAARTDQTSDLVEAGLVIGTVPAAGAELLPGAGQAVSVLVSLGPEPTPPPPPPPEPLPPVG